MVRYTLRSRPQTLSSNHRDSVITLAKNELGIDVIQRRINRSELYLADEVFLTGTAAHLTPVDGSTTATSETARWDFLRNSYKTSTSNV